MFVEKLKEENDLINQVVKLFTCNNYLMVGSSR